MPDDDVVPMSQMARELASTLQEAMEATSPVFDVADGIRADMERRGWSPTAAEVVALEWLQNSLRRMWSV